MAQKTIYVTDLKANVAGRGEIFSVKEVKKHQTKNGDPYYRIVLRDKTGVITGRIWKDAIPDCNVDTILPGDAVEIDFECQSYIGETQLIIKKMSKTDSFTAAELMTESKVNIDDLWQQLETYMNSVKDPDYRKLLQTLFADEKLTLAYKHSPAGEMVHHDFIGGLLTHVLEMITMADSLIPFYPMINRDLVITGIIFHDIGKIYEVEIDQTTFVRTKKGYLLGHISIGLLMLNDIAPKDFNPEKKLLLEHIILSHHQEIELGAVVRPATIEAALIALVDRASSHIRQYEKEMGLSKADKYGFGNYMKYQKAKIFLGEQPENTEAEQATMPIANSTTPSPGVEIDETLPF